MNDEEMTSRVRELLSGQPYYNVATASDGQPWNSPVWMARDDALNLY